MLEKPLTPKQEAEIARIKKQWLAEAKPYLSAPKPPAGTAVLDGLDSTNLAKIQMKYKKKIQEVIEASE